MLAALKNKDIEPIKEGFSQYPKWILEKLYGLEILEIGEPFKSGNYGGEFVPVKVRLADGTEKSTTIAVSNNNKNQIWILDGGI